MSGGKIVLLLKGLVVLGVIVGVWVRSRLRRRQERRSRSRTPIDGKREGTSRRR